MFVLISASPSLTLNSIKSNSSHHKPTKIPKIKFQLYPKPRKLPSKFITFAQNNNEDSVNKENKNKGDDAVKNERPRFNLKWVDLVLDPDPENIVAVGLTGVLAWASVQVLWQLFFISLAIITAALKYSFIAALLVFILITLL